jgi:hypothetical protein
MATVLNVEKLFEGERLSQDQKHVEHVLAWGVEVDDAATATTVSVLEANDGTTSIPPVNAIELAGGFRIKSKSVERDADNPNLFTVTAVLSNAADDQQQSGNGGEKLSIDVRVTTDVYEEPTYIDGAGVPICNAAGQPFSNTPTRTYYDDRIAITFRTAVVDQVSIDSCKGKTNSTPHTLTIRGYRRQFAVGTLKLVDAPVGTRVAQGEFLFDVAYTILHRRDGWKRKILNMGRMERSGTAGGLVNIRLKDRSDCTEDVPLDKDGKAIIDGIVGAAVNITAAAAGQRCYIEFDIEGRTSFANLLSGIR